MYNAAAGPKPRPPVAKPRRIRRPRTWWYSNRAGCAAGDVSGSGFGCTAAPVDERHRARRRNDDGRQASRPQRYDASVVDSRCRPFAGTRDRQVLTGYPPTTGACRPTWPPMLTTQVLREVNLTAVRLSVGLTRSSDDDHVRQRRPVPPLGKVQPSGSSSGSDCPSTSRVDSGNR
jgi:hypothetical protein